MDDANYPTVDDGESADKPEDKDEGKTALIPKSLLGGKKFKVGDTLSFKIEHEYESEVEISSPKAKPESESSAEDAGETGEEPTDESGPSMANAQEQLGALAG
jgi:hypothetical protein